MTVRCVGNFQVSTVKSTFTANFTVAECGNTFVVSVDSGPMHLAAAVTDRVLSIHTWSDPLKVGPYRPEAWVWKSDQIRSVREYREIGPQESQSVSFPDGAIGRLVDFVRQQLLG